MSRDNSCASKPLHEANEGQNEVRNPCVRKAVVRQEKQQKRRRQHHEGHVQQAQGQRSIDLIFENLFEEGVEDAEEFRVVPVVASGC